MKNKNPFGCRRMITEPRDFYGRRKILRELYTRLNGISFGSCAVVGERRIGKSSLLYHLTNPNTYASYLEDYKAYVFAYVNLQELAGETGNEVLRTATERLCEASNRQLQIDLAQVGNHDGFRRFLGEAKDAGLRLVLCCDEFEALSHSLKCNNDFFIFLRSLLDDGKLAMVTASRARLNVLCKRGKLEVSEFWNVFTHFPLMLMPENEARELVTRPFTRTDNTLSEEEILFILDLAGYHPLFLQIACFHLFEIKCERQQVEFAQVRDRFYEESFPHYTYAWDQLDRLEQEALISFVRDRSPIEPNVLHTLERKAVLNADLDKLSGGWHRFILDRSPRKRDVGPLLKLHLIPKGDFEFEIRTFDSRLGDIHESSALPMSPTKMATVLQTPDSFRLDQLTADQASVLRELGFTDHKDTITAENVPQRLGECLFETLMVGDIHVAFRLAQIESRTPRKTMRIQLGFDEDAVELARCPWELIHDRRSHLLLSNAIHLTRYISLPDPPPTLAGSFPLHLLYVAPRPSALESLSPDPEHASVNQALRFLEEKGELVIHPLDPPTFEELLKYVDGQHTVNILHFYGHGCFARRCPNCKRLNKPHLEQCTGCHIHLEEVPPEGFLAFEHGPVHREAHWISSTMLGWLLRPASLRLAVLLACSSGQVYGQTLLGGIAPGLVEAGVPAVIASQLPITVSAATSFAEGFYGALKADPSIPAAVNAGRRRLSVQEWFRPVLYLRSQDDEVDLFAR